MTDFVTAVRARLPPWGVLIVAGLWLVFSVNLLRSVGLPPGPPPSNCVFDCNGDSFWWDVGIAPYVLGFALVILASSIAALMRIRAGRVVLLIAIASFGCWHTGWLIWEVRPSTDGVFASIRAWRERAKVFDLLLLGLWYCWIALSFRCLLGQRAHRFYARSNA